MGIKGDLIIIGALAAGVILFKDRIASTFGEVGSSIGQGVGSLGQGIIEGVQGALNPFGAGNGNGNGGSSQLPPDQQSPPPSNVPNPVLPPFIPDESVQDTTNRVIEASQEVLQEFNNLSGIIEDASMADNIPDTGNVGFDQAAEILLEAGQQVNPDTGTIGIFDLGNTSEVEGLPLSQAAIDYYTSIGVPLNRLF